MATANHVRLEGHAGLTTLTVGLTVCRRVMRATTWIVTRLALIALFFLVVTPVGVILPLCRFVPLDRITPLFYDIVSAFYQTTRSPLILHTSFNVRDEPIVCKPTGCVPVLHAH